MSNASTLSKPQGQILQIDGIKALAIILVTAFHYFGQLSGWHMKVVDSQWFFGYWGDVSWTNGLEKISRFIAAYFYLGVNLFVIASGFGLYYSHLKSGKPFEPGTFFSKRVMKLLPPVVFAIGFLFVFRGLILNWGWPVDNPHQNLYPFLAGLNLFNDNWFFPPINGETWFLGLILQLYLVFPILMVLHRKLGNLGFLAVLFGFSVVFRILYYIVFQYQVSTLSYGLFAGRIFEFGVGMVLAQGVLQGVKIPLWPALGLLCFAGYFFPWTFPFADSLLGVGLFMGLWALFSRLKSGKISRFISDQSYMIFLIHHPFIWLMNQWGLKNMWTWEGLGAYLIFFPLILGISWICNQALDSLGKLFHGSQKP